MQDTFARDKWHTTYINVQPVPGNATSGKLKSYINLPAERAFLEKFQDMSIE